MPLPFQLIDSVFKQIERELDLLRQQRASVSRGHSVQQPLEVRLLHGEQGRSDLGGDKPGGRLAVFASERAR